MCIAIVKTEGATISDEYLENCFNNNKDGAGIACAFDNKLHICKGIFDKDTFIKAVRAAEKKAKGAMLIHCRIGTSGLMDKTNCHPHIVNSRCVMIHNGILKVDVPKNSKVSDTVIFTQKYLSELPKDFMKNDNLCELIEMAIGSGNKLAFLNNKGEYKIINETAGSWEDGVWYSNMSYSYDRTKPVADFRGYQNWNKEKGYPLFNQSIEVDTEKIVKQIKALSNFELIEYGEYPVYDIVAQKFVKENSKTMSNLSRYRYLDDIDDEAYEEYLYEIQLRGLVNELAEDEEEKVGA